MYSTASFNWRFSLLSLYSSIVISFRAGFPAYTELESTFPLTTLLAPIITLSPICDPPRIVAPPPINTLLPITVLR